MPTRFLIGVLGGMGPLATVDLLQKIIAATPAQRDQQHVPMAVWNVPQIPDRQRALAGIGESPLPALLDGIEHLNRLDVSHLIIPCNTAHHWFDELRSASRAPVLHIADATLAQTQLALAGTPSPRVGVIATHGTLAAGWYQQRLAALDIETVLPDEQEMDNLFVPGCYAVKRGEVAAGGALFGQLADRLAARGATQLILACTEVAPGLAAAQSRWLARSIDSTEALARRCVALWREQADL
ncbi:MULTISPECIES: aspartate/glutamate racemase family protein [Dickeya]|uniref:aspartate/glutamate racemase family protein n=1 Tax=Dickeya TaxID=204037 RepID=UPI00039F4AE2|nr:MULTISPECIES: amino acid racemase [Dickeya]MBO8134008.1 aspartate/glutamate racemase family protein [Dickeya fangzhongdai]UGA52484.1 amino acid racemase [Dickeya fangzhongdai]ULR32656.1 amino acid racemase [Dickeya fangzhongdai]UWH08823.1 amino acid racemase [Dickeya fangzhongdai]WES87555.1 amino acid racemase [Dickeya fangzhongdai]